jgi:hypothetical protein
VLARFDTDCIYDAIIHEGLSVNTDCSPKHIEAVGLSN